MHLVSNFMLVNSYVRAMHRPSDYLSYYTENSVPGKDFFILSLFKVTNYSIINAKGHRDVHRPNTTVREI